MKYLFDSEARVQTIIVAETKEEAINQYVRELGEIEEEKQYKISPDTYQPREEF